MQNADQGRAGELMGEGLRIGIVRAQFNDAITSRLATACYAELERLEVDPDDNDAAVVDIVYKIDDSTVTVLVVRVAHRREVYDR